MCKTLGQELWQEEKTVWFSRSGEEESDRRSGQKGQVMQVIQVKQRLQLCSVLTAGHSKWLNLISALRAYFGYMRKVAHGGGRDQGCGLLGPRERRGCLREPGRVGSCEKALVSGCVSNVWRAGCVAWEEEMSQAWLQHWAATASPSSPQALSR